MGEAGWMSGRQGGREEGRKTYGQSISDDEVEGSGIRYFHIVVVVQGRREVMLDVQIAIACHIW
jgi:hypothetical protein